MNSVDVVCWCFDVQIERTLDENIIDSGDVNLRQAIRPYNRV